jgi:protein-S-isoprenylcysteine O-methyltransferase Ste14
MNLPKRISSVGVVAITLLAVVLFFGLAVVSWGDLPGLLDHPARLGAFAVIAIAAFVSLFSGINLGGCVRADAKERWMLAPLVILSLGIAVLPPFTDRREILTIDGDASRYCGLALMLVGSILRVGPMFVLGRRFTWPLASQEKHRLIQSGFYRWVRHPSYAGAFLGAIGWALVFRSSVGLILVALLLPAFLPVVFAEEDLLVAEFGEGYKAYRRKTWRLIPFVY